MNKIIQYCYSNSDAIIDNIDQESIDVYLFLRKHFVESDVSRNPLFQFVYRSFYRLDNAGLTSEFKKEYFSLLEGYRNHKVIDIKEIVHSLHRIPNRKGQNSLQFSFVTKMINMIDENMPIYDSEVAKMFNFKTPPYTKTLPVRLDIYSNFYTELSRDYKYLITTIEFKQIFKQLTNKLNNVEQLSDIKKLDFVIWSGGKIKN